MALRGWLRVGGPVACGGHRARLEARPRVYGRVHGGRAGDVARAGLDPPR